ncbi:MAG: DUF6508 domain-containing protein [Proteocatella sp.]
MEKYSEILKYIAYFEDETSIYCEWICPGRSGGDLVSFEYPSYSKELTSFLNELNKSDLVAGEYLSLVEKSSTEDAKPLELIEFADLELLKGIITFYSKWESVYDGAWEDAAKDGIFLKLLHRLKELA